MAYTRPKIPLCVICKREIDLCLVRTHTSKYCTSCKNSWGIRSAYLAKQIEERRAREVLTD